MLAGAAAACSSSLPSSKPRSAPTSTPPVLANASGWSTFTSREAGVSFEYPREAKTVTYSYGDADDEESGLYSGKGFDWFAPFTAANCSATVAGGVSRDYSEGTEFWVTHIYRWFRRGSDYRIDIEPERTIAVRPIRVLAVGDGSALIFDRPDFFDPFDPRTPERVAVVNLPPRHSRDFLAVDLYFCGLDAEMATILRSLGSMRFFPPEVP